MDPFLGELRAFPYNFVPAGWEICDGRLLPISMNTALFSLIGTMYGGNGMTTFGLPDLRGRVPMGSGVAPGLTPRTQGELGGTETITLAASNLPSHTHPLLGTSAGATSVSPAGAALATGQVPDTASYAVATPDTAMAAGSVGASGNGLPVSNLQPYTVITWCIATAGIYPSRP